MCLTDFIDWRYIHTWYFRPLLRTVAPLSSLWPPPPQTKTIVKTTFRDWWLYSSFVLVSLCLRHRLNMGFDLQSLFGLLCTAVLIGWDHATPPSYTRALLVSQDRRHLFVTPWSAACRHFLLFFLGHQRSFIFIVNILSEESLTINY